MPGETGPADQGFEICWAVSGSNVANDGQVCEELVGEDSPKEEDGSRSPPPPVLVRDAETGEEIELQTRVWCDPPPTPPDVRLARKLAVEEARRAEEAAVQRAAAQELERQRKAERARARQLPPMPKDELRLEECFASMPFLRPRPRDKRGRPTKIDDELKAKVFVLGDMRDRFLAHLVTLLQVEEDAERARRDELALYKVTSAPHSRSARAWIEKRHERERAEARLRIDRIRRDNETALISKMGEFAFVR